MSNFIILFLNVLAFTTFLISFFSIPVLNAKIGSIQKKSKKLHAASHSLGERHLAIAENTDLGLVSDEELAEQLDKIAKALPLFANYLVVRSLESPQAAFSLSVRAAKDKVNNLSDTEKNRLFLKNCPPHVRKQLPERLRHLTNQLHDKNISGVAKKVTSLAAAKYICSKIEQQKLARFVHLLPKKKQNHNAESTAQVNDQLMSKEIVDHPNTPKQASPVELGNDEKSKDIHAKHIHEDNDLESGSGDV